MNSYLIKKKEDFSHVFRNGSFLNCNSFTINYAKKSKVVSTNSPRFGIIARKLPHVLGVQFHPESVGTKGGAALLRTFLEM